MHRMLIVVFEDENKAGEGKEALLQLEREGSISIDDYVLVAKRADSSTSVRRADQHGPFRIFDSEAKASAEVTAPGVGAAAGMHAGTLVEPHPGAIDEAFTNDVTNVLLPNRVALVADIEEEFAMPVDRRMESLGGVMFRWEED